MMLHLWLKSLGKLFIPEVGLETISQKILPSIMSVFIKRKEINVYPSEANVFAIFSLILLNKEYLIIKTFGKQSNLSSPKK